MVAPLVLVPGFMADFRAFLPQIKTLSPHYSIQIAPTLQGDSIAAIAKYVIERAPDSFALLGTGMGGIIAMEMLALAPRRVERLMLVNTSCQNELPAEAAAREPQIVGARAGRLAEVVREALPSEALAPGADRFDIMNSVVEMAEDMGPEAFVRQSRAMQRRFDQQGTLRRAKTPTLVACGEFDTIYPVRRHEFMAELMPNAALEVVRDAGHLPMLEQPERMTDLVRDWLHVEL